MLANEPTYRPVYKTLHRPLTLWGVDRRLFFLSLILGAGTFNLFYSFIAGVLVAIAMHAFSLWATQRDPKMLHILLRAGTYRAQYDAARSSSFELQVE